MLGHCLIREKVASAIRSQHGSTRDKCWGRQSATYLCCAVSRGRSWLGHRLIVTLECLSHPLEQTKLSLSFSNGRERLRVLDGCLPEQTKLSLSFSNGRERLRVLEGYFPEQMKLSLSFPNGRERFTRFGK